jgi:hypothetical protein
MSRNNYRGNNKPNGHPRGQTPGNRGGRGQRGGRPAQNSRFADYSQPIFDTNFAINATEDGRSFDAYSYSTLTDAFPF